MGLSTCARIIFIGSLLFIVLSETHITGSNAKSSAATEEQRKEVEKVKAELNAALEKYDADVGDAKSIIVQPAWTQADASNPPPKDIPKVAVTDEKLHEIEALRDVIHKAVAKDEYAPSIVNTSAGDSEVLEELKTKYKSKVVMETLLTSITSSEEEEEERRHLSSESESMEHHVDDSIILVAQSTPGEVLGNGDDDDDEEDTDSLDNDEPNVVEANLDQMESDIDISKLHSLEISKRRTKEVFILKSIEEDYSFDLGEGIQQWAHILHNGEEYFIGRRHVDLFIVRKNVAKYEPGKVLHVGQAITYLETYSFWNLAQQQQEGVIIIASRDRVLWYRGNTKTGQLDLYWEWVIGSAISGLTYFNIDARDYLAISSNESGRIGYYALNIYRFELSKQEFWIAQRMQLQFPCKEVTLLDTGRDILLAVAQNNTAAIYSFNPHEEDDVDYVRFKLLRSIPSEGIEIIAGFKMGGRSYLALGGMQPQIMLYQQGNLVPVTMLGNNFGIVDLFFPIPVRTYRDDLILLVQHRVDFGTHSVTVLESLIWDGKAFEVGVPVPCHFGDHVEYGVSCMLDIQRDEGLKGAALLRRGDETSIIVPRHNAESGLFRLHAELLLKNSELLDLQDIFSFLKDWVKEHDELVAKAQEYLKAPPTPTKPAELDLSNMASLKVPELYFEGEFEELYVNGYKWKPEDTETDLDVVLEKMEQLEIDFNSKRQKRGVRQSGPILDSMDFDLVEADNLIVDQVNGEKFYIQNGELVFEGILNAPNLLVTDEVEHARQYRDIMEEDSLSIEGDLEFTEINGISWSEIRDNLVFRDAHLQLEELEVEGEVIAEDTFSMKQLNTFDFPDDFLWSNGPSSSIIRGEKTFIGNLTANAIDTEGLINGVNPLEAITLDDEQDWKGTPTFTQLKVSEIFELNGTVRGAGIKDFPNNPTLQDQNFITAACNFAHLEVQGQLYINDTIDDIPSLAPVLLDVIQKPQDPAEEILIPSRKHFQNVVFPMDFNVQSNKINEIPIQEFVTLHTQQELQCPALVGYVYFNNLTVVGEFDGVRLEELMQNSIKIDEPQVSEKTQLNFVEIMHADTVNIKDILNDIPLSAYQTLDEPLVMAEAHFETLTTHTMNIQKDITGSGQLNGKNLLDFLQQRTWSNSTAMGNIFLEELILGEGLESEELHNLDANFVFQFLAQISDLPEMILDGKIQVDRVVVTGDVQVNQLNGQNFDEDIQLTAIWLNRPNYLSTKLEFLESVEIDKELIVDGDFNGQNLPELIDDMVFHLPANGTVLILAPKSFLKDVHVQGNTRVDAINGVPFTSIATKTGINHFNGSLRINGNLIIDELTLSGHINGYPISEMSNLVRFDEQLQAFVLRGETVFAVPSQFDDLTVNGSLNEFSHVGDFFADLAFKKEISELKGKNTFTGRVTIQEGAFINKLNEHDLLTLLKNIVYINSAQPVVVETPVTFENTVDMTDLTIQKKLTVENISGCALEEWQTDTLRVDQAQDIEVPLIFAVGSLDGNALNVDQLNNVSLERLISLHSPQNLSSDLKFSEIYLDGEITVHGLVNNVDLQQEYENTLLTHGDQRVHTPLALQNVNVRGDLLINAPINDNQHFEQVAKVTDNLDFQSPLHFQQISARSMQTNDLLSGIDMEQWYNESLWQQGRNRQVIEGKWRVRRLMVKKGPTMPSYLQNLPLMTYNPSLRAATGEEQQSQNFDRLCQKIAKILSKQQKRAYYLKHLEQRLELLMAEGAVIERAFVVRHNDAHYLLVNLGCKSLLYLWEAASKEFKLWEELETGPIDEITLIDDGKGTLKFTTKAKRAEQLNCTGKSLSNWQLSESKQWGSEHKANYKRGMLFTKTFISSTQNPLANPATRAGKPDLNFTDFKLLISRILNDLIERLDQQININQLSIPESDLFDESLVEDFVAIMHELKKQKIYPATTFDNITLERLNIPDNQAQVLAARVVETIWPVIVDIQEVCSYLRDTPDYRHSVCKHITQILGETVRDVLLLANEEPKIFEDIVYDDNGNEEVERIIKRIYMLQTELDRLAKELDAREDESDKMENTEISKTAATKEYATKENAASFSSKLIDVPEFMSQEETAAHSSTTGATEMVDSLSTAKVFKDTIANIEAETTSQSHDQSNSKHRTVSGTLSGNRSTTQSSSHSSSQPNSQHITESVNKSSALLKTQSNTKSNTQSSSMNGTLSSSQPSIRSIAQSNSQFHVQFTTQPDTRSNIHLNTQFTDQFNSQFNTQPNAKNSSQPILHRNSSQSTGFQKETLTLQIGSATNMSTLVISTQPQGLHVHLNSSNNDRIQSLNATRPHALITLRIRDETLLAFVENCCLVHILRYHHHLARFEAFSEFSTDLEVVHLLTLELPNANGVYSYFLATVLPDRITFYEVMVAGHKELPILGGDGCN